MHYEIEKDVPMPEKNEIKRKYPFQNMNKGDSFLVPNDSKLPYWK